MKKGNSMLSSELRNISKEVDSNYPEDCAPYKIPPQILQKYLTVGDNDCFNFFQSLISKASPYWSLTVDELWNNLKALFFSQWNFDSDNTSIYLVFWGPLSLIFFSHLLHNDPYTETFNVIYPGLIDLGVIVLTAFALFVYSNVLNFPHNRYIEHLCVSSYVNLFTILYCCVTLAASEVLMIIFTIIFVLCTVYFHFNLYNRAIKPTLFQFLILLLILAVFYGCSAFLYVQSFKSHQTTSTAKTVENHLMQRHYGNDF